MLQSRERGIPSVRNTAIWVNLLFVYCSCTRGRQVNVHWRMKNRIEPFL